MPDQLQKPAASGRNEREAARKQAKLSSQQIEQELQAAIESGDHLRILEMLDSAPAPIKKQPEFILLRAFSLLSLGYEMEALGLLLEVERKNPRLTEVYSPLAMIYISQDWPAHALQAANRALSRRDVRDEERSSLEEVVQEATADLQQLVDRFAISIETARQAAFFNEKAQMALKDNKFTEADDFARKAIKLLPAWGAPHNNRAEALYFMGKTGEAIDVLSAVLAREPENVFTLRSLVICYYGLDQQEQARFHASRLEALAHQFAAGSMEMEHVITALALVEDTPALWKIARRYLTEPPESLFSRSWHCLAVAAVRSKKWKNAQDLMERANEVDELAPAPKNFLDHLAAARQKVPARLEWMPPEYPGADLFINAAILSEMEALVKGLSDTLSPFQKRRLEHFFQKYPFVKTVLKRWLWSEETHPLARNLLVLLDHPDTDAEILRFVFSQAGTQEARLNTLMKFNQTGRYTGSLVMKIWNENLGEWREVKLTTQKIGSVPPKARPETLAMIDKAVRAKKPEESIALLRKAVEGEPTSALALFNLGVKLAQNGHPEEGEALIHQSVIVDPGYTYGHASIAYSEAGSGNVQSALEHLGFVSQADLIAQDTALIANLAWGLVALEKRDLKTARRHFEIADGFNPEHPLLSDFEEKLSQAENFSFMFEFQRNSALRAHQKLLKTPLTAATTLPACLETYSREMLVGSARFLRTRLTGKKVELVTGLAETLLDLKFLQVVLTEVMAEKEVEALRWVLEGGGVRPWNEFRTKYGDDMDEPVNWDYHEPESIPGRLRRSAMFYTGILAGQQVVFIPADVRALLLSLLK